MRYTGLALALLAVGSAAAGAQQRQGTGSAVQPVLIRNATVMTVSRATLPNTDVLLRDGKIVAIGTNLPAGNARVIDATGKWVTPGIIDAHSHAMSDAINEGTFSVTSMTRVADILNPTSESIYRQLAGGITTSHILHGSANAIGGQNAVVKFKYGRPLSEMMFPGAMPGIKFALGENVKRSSRTPQAGGPPARYPTTRMGVEEVIRDAFVRAQNYKAEWDDYRAASARNRNLVAPRRDLELEALVEVLDGTRLVHAHSYRADEIMMILNLAEEFGFRIATLQHVLEGYKVAPEIARHGAGASTFADSWAYKLEAYDAIPHNAAIMVRAGVVVSLNSDSDERARRMNVDAAKMMKYGGLTEQEAMALITLNPAKQLRIDSKVGSIDVGKDADVLIWNDHPLSVYAMVETTFIDGEVFFDRQDDVRMRAENLAERQRLQRLEPNGGEPARPAAQGRPGGGGPGEGAEATAATTAATTTSGGVR